MPVFRIHRIRESARQQFRWAAHTSGVSQLKPKDYQDGGQIDAAGFYAAWSVMRSRNEPLHVGDLLEQEGGGLKICKYVGFEEARWMLPEVKNGLEDLPVAAGPGESE